MAADAVRGAEGRNARAFGGVEDSDDAVVFDADIAIESWRWFRVSELPGGPVSRCRGP